MRKIPPPYDVNELEKFVKIEVDRILNFVKTDCNNWQEAEFLLEDFANRNSGKGHGPCCARFVKEVIFFVKWKWESDMHYQNWTKRKMK